MSTPPESIQISAIVEIRNRAESDLHRVRRTLEKVQARVAAAEMKVKLLDDTITQLTGQKKQTLSQKDHVLNVINRHDGESFTVQEIYDALVEDGVALSAANPKASIQVAANRLVDDGVILGIASERGKLYMRKPKPQATEKPEEEEEPEKEDF